MLEAPRNEEDVRRRLDELIRSRPGASYAAASRLLGRNHAYVQQFIRRGQPRRLSAADIRRLADWLDVSVHCLTVREDDTVRAARALAPPALVHLDVLDGETPAPSGDSTVSEGIPGIRPGEADGGRRPAAPHLRMPFARAHLEDWLGGPAERLVLFRMTNDCMSPTLVAGDLVFVDAGDRRIAGDGLYLLRLEAGRLALRRLTLSPCGRRVTVSCDNPSYQRWHELPVERLDPVGPVRGCLHRM